MNFELISDYQPTGDQPEAIAQLTEGILKGVPAQTLLGVTGSGKTFTIANVIKNINKPTLILSHNKTLAAQLYGEFKNFFPNNAVEYYVSYYDYYQPEAYLPSSDTYIEKDLQINEEIDKLRLAATSALLSGRKDVVVISSVSCIYGMGNPSDFYNNVIEIKKGKLLDRNVFLRRLVDSLYVRNDLELNRGNFRVKGDTVDIYLAYSDNLLRVMFWDDEIDSIEEVDPVSGIRLASFDEYKIYPANLFMTTKESQLQAIYQIEDDLAKEVAKFEEEGKHYEAKRLYERVTYDMEMIRELGHCSGIENYSRYFDGRVAGTRPYCLLDFFPDDFLIVIDESHVSVPQIRAMYGGDRARKTNLVEYGFRMESAFDHSPYDIHRHFSMLSHLSLCLSVHRLRKYLCCLQSWLPCRYRRHFPDNPANSPMFSFPYQMQQRRKVSRFHSHRQVHIISHLLLQPMHFYVISPSVSDRPIPTGLPCCKPYVRILRSAFYFLLP